MLRRNRRPRRHTESKMQKGQRFLPSRGVPPSQSQKMIQINNSIRKLLHKKNRCCVLFFCRISRFSCIYFSYNKITQCCYKVYVKGIRGTCLWFSFSFSGDFRRKILIFYNGNGKGWMSGWKKMRKCWSKRKPWGMKPRRPWNFGKRFFISSRPWRLMEAKRLRTFLGPSTFMEHLAQMDLPQKLESRWCSTRHLTFQHAWWQWPMKSITSREARRTPMALLQRSRTGLTSSRKNLKRENSWKKKGWTSSSIKTGLKKKSSLAKMWKRHPGLG